MRISEYLVRVGNALMPVLMVTGIVVSSTAYALDHRVKPAPSSALAADDDQDQDDDQSETHSDSSASRADPRESHASDSQSLSEQLKNTMSPMATDLTKAPLDALGSVVDATRNAIRFYLAGNKGEALKSLEFAADQGHAPAQWKLARMYAEGDGVPRDDLRAFEAFSRVCDRHADESPNSPTAPFVSNSFVALGSYYLNGIPNSAVKPNPVRAREMFSYSASYFGDPQAQLILGRLYLEGIGGTKDMKQALRWFNLSAEKGNRVAQAQLGQLLFSGEAGMKQRARGLMWLDVARVGADPQKEAWIIEAHEEALEKASEADRFAASAYMSQRERIKKN